MSVVNGLKRLREILLDLAAQPNCAEICHYDGQQVKWFIEDLDRAIRRYESEAARIRKYYPGGRR